jgi:leader peptidase (prepilin peptidase)/N-methyltransferase
MYRALFFTDPLYSVLAQIYLFVLGAVVGSFLNVCIYRIPLQQSIVTPRSRCPKCNQNIRWYYNFPILSYLMLRGKCASCGERISPVYPFVEFITGTVFVLLYRHFGISIPFAIYAFFACSTIVLIFIDYYHRLLPWKVTFPAIAVGLATSFVNPYLRPLESLIGFLAGAFILTFVFVTFKWIRKKEGLGDGDIVMMAMVGAFLGWQQVLLVLFFSSMLGTIVGIISMTVFKKGSDFLYPYGTFIGAAAIAAVFWGEQVWNFYVMR